MPRFLTLQTEIIILKGKIKAAKKRVNYRWIQLNAANKTVKLKKSAMRLDLGGIAKGYTVDQVMKVLQDKGIKQGLVNGGGDLVVSQAPPQKSAWEIQLQDSLLLLENTAIASSGSTFKYLAWQGKRYSHIIDPRTGMGITHPNMISVQAENCMMADAFASAFSVMKRKKWEKLIEKYRLQIYIHEEKI